MTVLPAVEVSVVVLSYNRVHLLERTLRACLDPKIADGVPFEVIVVDNHPDRLAQDLLARFAAEAPFAVRYLADPHRNYSVVRNLGIRAARGRYVAFVDDDEQPQAGWISELHRCLERTGADAAFGRKLPEFETGSPPDWDPQALLFTLDRQEPEDTEIHMFGRLRRPGKGLGTGNAAFRVATCFDRPEPLAVAFGYGGGEDTHLLFRLAQEGRRFVWCPNAVVVEFMERERIDPAYMIKRMRRGSQHYAACRIATSRSKLMTWAKVTALGLAQFGVHLGLYLVSGEFLGGKAIDHRIGMAKGLGKLTWRAPIGFIDESGRLTGDPPGAPDLSIVIATYDRPDLLAATLASCLAQRNGLGLALELVVIDNHPSGNARPVVEAAMKAGRFPVRYEADLTRNMSVLRNRGFAEARGGLVALIDDDEVADPDWLDHLVGALRKAGGDVAVGPRRAVFATGAAPPYDPQGRQFTRDLGLADGAEIILTTASGKPRYGLGTGNSLYDAARCFPDPARAMRVEFGDAGGEDAEFFARLHRQGRRIVWAAGAVVTETVPAHRTAISYRLLRTRRETQHYVNIYLDAARHRRITWASLMLKGLIQVVAGAAITVLTAEFASKRRIFGRLLVAHGLGKLTSRRGIGYIQEQKSL